MGKNEMQLKSTHLILEIICITFAKLIIFCSPNHTNMAH
jgi:hypothetical protein